jgi:hypothetical protein
MMLQTGAVFIVVEHHIIPKYIDIKVPTVYVGGGPLARRNLVIGDGSLHSGGTGPATRNGKCATYGQRYGQKSLFHHLYVSLFLKNR